MAFEYLTNLPLEQARHDYIALLMEKGMAPTAEIIPAAEAAGRITAEAVYANISAPHYAASAMDGIAILAKDSFGATESTPITLSADKYIVVDTGDPIPDGCDAVLDDEHKRTASLGAV